MKRIIEGVEYRSAPEVKPLSCLGCDALDAADMACYYLHHDNDGEFLKDACKGKIWKKVRKGGK